MSNYTNDNGTTIQTWPNGRSYTYRGDVHAPSIEIEDGDTWRTATADEYRAVKINVLANIYADRDVLCCDSALVDDLIKAAGSGDLRGDLGDAFGIDEIRNMYADPSGWDLEKCRDYVADLDDVGSVDALDPWSMDRDALAEALGNVGIDVRDDETIDTLREAVIANMDDETIDGLDTWRAKAAELAQDNPREPYEWWRVSSWLCGQLDKIGEVTIDNDYGYWWGRTCTGQDWIMDGTLQDVAAQFVD